MSLCSLLTQHLVNFHCSSKCEHRAGTRVRSAAFKIRSTCLDRIYTLCQLLIIILTISCHFRVNKASHSGVEWAFIAVQCFFFFLVVQTQSLHTKKNPLSCVGHKEGKKEILFIRKVPQHLHLSFMQTSYRKNTHIELELLLLNNNFDNFR